MANEQNLIPIKKGELTKEEAKKRGSNGGKKSAESKKEKKIFKEAIEKQIGKSIDKMVESMINQVIKKGSVPAFVELRNSIGEKPKDEMEVSGNINNPYENISEEELRKLANDTNRNTKSS